MARTFPTIMIGLFGLELKSLGTPSATDIQSFSDIDDLTAEQIASPVPFASFEQDYWLLDGSFKFIPDDTSDLHVGYVSQSMSDADGDFSTPPELTITFDAEYDSDGLTLYFNRFVDVWATSIQVIYYDAADVVLSNETYLNDQWYFSTFEPIEGFKKIVVKFLSTNTPYRYLRLSDIYYGNQLVFSDETVISASVVEELDPISKALPIGTIEAKLKTDENFSLFDQGGDYGDISEQQPVKVYETIDGVLNLIGKYYMDTWKSPSESELEISAVDIIGVLDLNSFPGWFQLSPGENLEDLIEDLLDPFGIPYEVDSEIATSKIYGWIPPGTYREALQQVCFAAGAMVVCSRSNGVLIKPSRIPYDETTYGYYDYEYGSGSGGNYDNEITEDVIIAGQQVELTQQVTGIELTTHDYASGSDSEEIFNDSLDPGTYTFTFSEPMESITVTGASKDSDGPNFVTVTVSVAGTVEITGTPYVDTERVLTFSETVSEYVKPNIISVTEATLVNSGNGSQVLSRLASYFRQRYRSRVGLILPENQAGDVVLIDTIHDRQLRSAIEKMNLDLAGGFNAKAELLGVLEEAS